MYEEDMSMHGYGIRCCLVTTSDGKINITNDILRVKSDLGAQWSSIKLDYCIGG